MKIAILGGTGDLGGGLALRWAADADHRIVVGSRSADRAVEAADDYRAALARRDQCGPDGDAVSSVAGSTNSEAVVGADVVVVAVPAEHVGTTIESVAGRFEDGAILVSPAVGLEPHSAGFRARPPADVAKEGTEEGSRLPESRPVESVTALAASAAPSHVPVVGAFHTLAAGRLSGLDRTLGIDTLVVGDDPAARHAIAGLAEEIEGVRAIDAGGLANAPAVESVTALLLTLARHDPGLTDAGVRFQ